MELRVCEAEGKVHLLVAGDLDYSSRDSFEAEMRHLMARTASIQVNCTYMKFVDSSGVAALVACCEDAAATGVEVRLTHIDPEVMYVLDLLGVREILPVA